MTDLDTLFVDKEDAGQRLDLYLKKKLPTYSRTYFQKLIDQHLVLVNGQVIKKRVLVEENDEIEIEFALTEELSIEPENLQLPILYEDDDLLAINKPANCVVHPALGHPRHTVVNFLAFHLSLQTQELRPGIVHRLDKDTTGVLLCAKNLHCHEKLVDLFSSRNIQKEYLAVCYLKPRQNEICTFIARDPKNRQKMAVTPQGKIAETRLELLSFIPPLSILRLFPKTGRTHQLRLHLSYLDSPILGDSLYGNKTINQKFHATRQYLHAYSLSFIHPFTQKPLLLKAPLPEDMQKYFPNW